VSTGFINSVDKITGGFLDSDEKAKFGQDSQDSASGSAPNSISGKYKELISGKNKGIGPKMWFTEGSDWYKVFGYRFSIAYVDPNKPGGDIESALSLHAVLSNSSSEGSGDPFGLESNTIDAPLSNKKPNKNIKWAHFTLPIPPSNIVTKPVFASRATATLGGVVEETSQVKFWLNSMSGTTGTSLSRVADDRNTRNHMADKFREAIETTGLLAGVFAGANDLVNKFGGIADTAVDGFNAFKEGDVAGGLGAVTGAINNTLTPSIPYSKSAVDNRSNGFVEAQELQKFFFMYNSLKGRYPKNFALVFTNFKTDQSFRCIVKDFQLLQSSENPYLWKYNIGLQCWNVRTSKELFLDTSGSEPFDRFGSGGDLKAVNTLTSNQLLGVFSNIKTLF